MCHRCFRQTRQQQIKLLRLSFLLQGVYFLFDLSSFVVPLLYLKGLRKRAHWISSQCALTITNFCNMIAGPFEKSLGYHPDTSRSMGISTD